MKKEFRVKMDGDAVVWAHDVKEAIDEVRANIGFYLFAEETGLEDQCEPGCDECEDRLESL